MTKKLFLAACDVAMQACRDKLLQIYILGLKILQTAMQPPVCGDDIPHKVVNKTVSPFIPLLIDKITELNFRSRDLSMKTLVGLFRHPAMDVKQFIEAIMDLAVKGPAPDKAPWRTVLARTESLLHMIQEYGINPKAWDWTVVFQHLIVPTLYH